MQAIRSMTAELWAFTRVAALLLRDRELYVPPRVRAGEDVAVLVHGLLATAGVMRPLRDQLERTPGIHTATFTYAPPVGVQEGALALSTVLGRLPEGVRIHLVGHSLGGLIVRWYVQELPCDPRVLQTISVGTPFGGVRRARYMPGQAGRDIEVDSYVLRRLRESGPIGQSIDHLSIFGSDDKTATANAAYPAGERCVINGCGHNGLLFHPEVADIVTARILRHRGADR
jgi:triacylglycerol lipase